MLPARVQRLLRLHPRLHLPIQLIFGLLTATLLTACTDKPATVSTAERTKAVAEKQKTTQEKMPDQTTLARAVESLTSTQDTPPPTPAKK